MGEYKRIIETLRVAEFEGAKATMNVLEGVKKLVANESYTNAAIEAVESLLEENYEKELFSLLMEHGTKVIAGYTISNNSGIGIIYLDDEQAVIKDGEYYALCEVKDFGETVQIQFISEDDQEDMNEDTCYIIYGEMYIPLDECMRV